MGNAAGGQRGGNAIVASPEAEMKALLAVMQADLPRCVMHSRLGTGKFMRSYIVRHGGTSLVLKVYMARPQPVGSSSVGGTGNASGNLGVTTGVGAIPLYGNAGPAAGMMLTAQISSNTTGNPSMEEDLTPISIEFTRLLRLLPPSKYPNLMPATAWLRSGPPSNRRGGGGGSGAGSGVGGGISGLGSSSSGALAPVYVLRQYFASNLSDRLSTRPFLRDVERRWLVFQLLKCLEIAHEAGAAHGDVKPENVMVATTGWLVLTDFAPHKPVAIPHDDPTNFTYYFDGSGRQRCYLAPERFYVKEVGGSGSTKSQPGSSVSSPPPSATGSSATAGITTTGTAGITREADRPTNLTAAMDIFSLGCVIAEIFLDGTPLLDLPAMLQYLSSSADALAPTVSGPLYQDTPVKVDEDHPARALLTRISDPLIRNVVIDMTQKDPSKRLSASEYLKILLGRHSSSTGEDDINSTTTSSVAAHTSALPGYLESVVYPLFLRQHWSGVTPDARVWLVCEKYGELVVSLTGGRRDDQGAAYFGAAVGANSGTNASSTATSTTSKRRQAVQAALFSLDPRQSLLLLPSVAQILRRTDMDDKRISGRAVLADGADEVLSKARFGYSALVVQTEAALKAATANTVSSTDSEVIDSADISFRTAGLTDVLSRARAQIANIDSLLASLDNMEFSSDDVVQDMDTSASPPTDKVASAALAAIEEAGLHNGEFDPFSEWRGHSSGGNSTGMPRDIFSLPHSTENTRSEGLILVINTLTAAYRHLSSSAAKIICLQLLARLTQFTPDEIALQRVIPLALLATEDPVATVRVTGLRTVATLASSVEHFAAAEANYFSTYLFPALAKLATDTETTVRLSFAAALGPLALAAKRFLDRTHLVFYNSTIATMSGDPSLGGVFSGGSGTITPSNGQTGVTTGGGPGCSLDRLVVEFPYETRLEALRETVSRWIRDLILDGASSGVSSATIPGASPAATSSLDPRRQRHPATDSAVKRVLLAHLVELCAFFGPEAAQERLLTQLLTFFNDRCWQLRAAFCERLPAVGAFLGGTATSEYVAPCLESTVADVEERVAVSAVRAITSLVRLGLVSRLSISEFIRRCSPLLLHASPTLRESAVQLMVTVSKLFGPVDTTVFLLPLLAPFLKDSRLPVVAVPSSFTAEALSTALKPPLTAAQLRDGLSSQLLRLSQAPGSPLILDNILMSAILPPMDLPSTSTESSDNTEKEKLSLVEGYLAAAAQELFNKTLRWRSAALLAEAARVANDNRLAAAAAASSATGATTSVPAGSNANTTPHGSHRPGTQSASQSLSYGGMSATALDAAVSWVQVPVTRFAPPLAEELRRSAVSLDTRDEPRNRQKLRTLFLGASHRNIRLVGGAEDDPTLAPSSLPSTAGTSAVSGTEGYSSGAAAGMSSTAILRRLRALDVPPLPPDLGALNVPYDGFASASSNLAGGSGGNSGMSGAASASGLPAGSGTGGISGSGVTSGASVGQSTGGSDADLSSDPVRGSNWRPREGVLLTTLREHSGAVNRLAVAADHSFFVSASADRTVRVWQSRALDRVAFPRSAAMYCGHRAAVTDAVTVEGTHSIASAGADGSVHVWRVDMASSSSGNAGSNASGANGPNITTSGGGLDRPFGSPHDRSARVTGTSMVRMVDAAEGPIAAVAHYNSDVASIVTFVTDAGGLHGWDLRAPKPAFHLPPRPELGAATALTVAPDRNWLAVGTFGGYISLFDLRYNTTSALWRHSSGGPIHRLASCKNAKSSGSSSSSGASGPVVAGLPATEGAYLFVASRGNEAAVFGLPEGGECFKCFRTLALDDSKAAVTPLPSLEPIALPRIGSSQSIITSRGLGTSILSAPLLASQGHTSLTGATAAFVDPVAASAAVATAYGPNSGSVRAMIGRVSAQNASYLITAGSDAAIRYWDLRGPDGCYTVAGLPPAAPRSLFVARRVGDRPAGRLFVCYASAVPASSRLLQSHVPLREGRGLLAPPSGFNDAVTDLKDIESPMRLLLSSSRDGEIKIWR